MHFYYFGNHKLQTKPLINTFYHGTIIHSLELTSVYYHVAFTRSYKLIGFLKRSVLDDVIVIEGVLFVLKGNVQQLDGSTVNNRSFLELFLI